MTVPKKKRRQLLSFEGINFPCLPSIKEANKSMSKLIVESLSHDPLLAPKEYDKEASDILDKGKIYIGVNIEDLFFIVTRVLFIADL